MDYIFPFCACRHFCYECDIQISLKNDGEYLFLSKYLLALPDKAVEELGIVEFIVCLYIFIGWEIALNHAAKHDSKILVEETIVGREIECGVLGMNEPKASGVGEVLSAEEFYSYDAKYNNEESRTVVDPELPEGKAEEIRKDAVAIFKALDCSGLSRVDFFLTKDTNEVVFNEINTLPGFTAISMYPMLWEARGLSKKALVQKLIDLAMNRYDV